MTFLCNLFISKPLVIFFLLLFWLVKSRYAFLLESRLTSLLSVKTLAAGSAISILNSVCALLRELYASENIAGYIALLSIAGWWAILFQLSVLRPWNEKANDYSLRSFLIWDFKVRIREVRASLRCEVGVVNPAPNIWAIKLYTQSDMEKSQWFDYSALMRIWDLYKSFILSLGINLRKFFDIMTIFTMSIMIFQNIQFFNTQNLPEIDVILFSNLIFLQVKFKKMCQKVWQLSPGRKNCLCEQKCAACAPESRLLTPCSQFCKDLREAINILRDARFFALSCTFCILLHWLFPLVGVIRNIYFCK